MVQDSANNVALGALALRICDRGRSPVQLTGPEERVALGPAFADGRLLEDPHGVQFIDERTLVLAATEHVLRTESVALLSAPKACFEYLDDIFAKEIGKELRVSAHVLAELHNSGQLDGFVWARQAIETGVGVFDVLHVMEGAVPLFREAQAEAMLEFFSGHYETVKGDLAGGMLYAKLHPWLARQPDLSRKLMEMHMVAPQEASASLYGSALQALILHNFNEGFKLALAAVRHPTDLISQPALHRLGLLNFAEPPQCEARAQVISFCADIVRTIGHRDLPTAVQTLARLLPEAEAAIVPVLEEAAATENPQVLYVLSEALSRERNLRDRPWYWPLFRRLAVTKADQKGIVDNLDMVLMDWVRKPDWQERAMEFLDAWIANQSREALRDASLEKHFDATFHHLKEKLDLLGDALTRWLLHDDLRYPIVAFRTISRLRADGVQTLVLDPAILNELDANGMLFLVRRILGYIVGDDAQIGLIFSLVRTRDAKVRTLGLVADVLRTHVGYDYPHQTIEFLQARQASPDEDEEVKKLCAEVIAALQSHLADLDALPWLKELVPPSGKSYRFAKERAKQMNEAFEDASKDSIWRQITSRVVLKAGLRSFQTINGQYTTPMELKSVSHSMALPRSEIADPAGAARDRYFFKTVPKGVS